MPAIITRVFGEGFRVFFPVGRSLWPVCRSGLGPVADSALSGAGIRHDAAAMWHAHEMIFGYATAALGGFFLTAVPNWTGAPDARARFITLAAGLWLAGRMAMWFSGALPAALVAVVDLAFVPILAAKILTQLIKRPKPQNMVFLVLLSLIWVADLMTHLEWMGITNDTLQTGLAGRASDPVCDDRHIGRAYYAGLYAQRYEARRRARGQLAGLGPGIRQGGNGLGVTCAALSLDPGGRAGGRRVGAGFGRCADSAHGPLARGLGGPATDSAGAASGAGHAGAGSDPLGAGGSGSWERGRSPARTGHRLRRWHDPCGHEPRRAGA